MLITENCVICVLYNSRVPLHSIRVIMSYITGFLKHCKVFILTCKLYGIMLLISLVLDILHPFFFVVLWIYGSFLDLCALDLWLFGPCYELIFIFYQLLLLGDRVEEAFKELENSCHNMDTALPFRFFKWSTMPW